MERPPPSQRGSTLAIAAAAALLVVLDLMRPYYGVGLRPWQWAAGLALVVLAAARGRAGGGAFRELVPALALGALLVPTFVDHARGLGNGDGMHYYSYLRSVLFDGDLFLENDYVLLGWHDPKAPNVLPVGAPLLWSPFVVAIHAVRSVARLFGLGPPTGVEPVYQAAACLATLAYGALALFLLWSTLRRFVDPWSAFWATVLCWIGSPLRFYLSVLPGLAHGVEFFGATLVLLTLVRLREARDPRAAALCGAACGVTFLARSQDGLLLALPAFEIVYQAARARDARHALRGLAPMLTAFLLVALPQMAVWQVMFGAPVLIPHQKLHGADFLHTAHPQLAGALFSERGGFFASYPVMAVAVAGLLVLARRERRYVLLLLPVMGAMWFVNASVFDWYQVRRFTGLVPLLAPALAVVLAPLVRRAPALVAVLAFLALRYDLAVDGRRTQPGDPVPVGVALTDVADGLTADVYRGVERVAPRAAAALLDVYAGAGVLRGESTRVDLGREPLAFLRLPLPARHLSEVETEDGAPCRWVTDTDARLFLSLAWRGPTLVTVRARPLETEAPQTMELVWNEAALGAQEMAAGWGEYRFSVPAEAVRLGTNVFVLRFSRAPVFHRVRGYGPREVRPAALAVIELRRGGA
jgi:hypothetical protein